MKLGWILAGITLTFVCWGMYGPILHKGQIGLDGSKLRAFLCVGLAYFIVAIIIPAVILWTQGELHFSWQDRTGVTWSLIAGTAGALGALGIIVALSSGGKPVYVMPLVFGCAPVVNVFIAMRLMKETETPSALFYAGVILVVVGAATVLIFQPKAVGAKHAADNINYENIPAIDDAEPPPDAG